MNSGPLDGIPLWGFFLLSVAAGMLAVEVGYRFGKRRHARSLDEKEASVSAMVGSMLGLLALMLGFSFSMAAARFDARRQSVLNEANAIGTTYLRTQLLPEPQRSESAELIRRYTRIRVEYIPARRIDELFAESSVIHNELWSRAVAVAEKDPHSMVIGLYLQSLNEMIDLNQQRIFVSLQSRIPLTIWLTLFGLTLLGLMSIGYQSGVSGTRRSPEMPLLTVAFAVVLYLIVDLDRLHEGLLRVSQQSTIDVLKTMKNESH
ncbi:bestrophin-like domain [Planctomicrobium piriforme]|uniref:DUF4239 domain-containing protein n=1 Tax=Planctomicrobium piriforme TaxID=1576369 RepID=A0A1I3E6S2_9PLAN|nr:hypothetical protein [Planctomicrobium piriforme]SFH94569.1 hypothetical protein SAMN05421753_104100 [Planctomicrobium piriforme]